MTGWPIGYGRIVVREVSSTFEAALACAEGTQSPFWLLAERQTAARGRRGRRWESLAGNFAATLVLRPQDTPARAALRSFVVSLALYQTLVEVTGKDYLFDLKWPNDVLLNGGKVAGILLESSGKAGRVDILSIGIGVNLAMAPDVSDVEPEAVKPVSLLGETSVQVLPEDFLDILAKHYASLEAVFQQDGFPAIRAAWLSKAARIGERIIVRTGKEEQRGIFEDVDADGHLVLRGPRGVSKIAAADVYF